MRTTHGELAGLLGVAAPASTLVEGAPNLLTLVKVGPALSGVSVSSGPGAAFSAVLTPDGNAVDEHGAAPTTARADLQPPKAEVARQLTDPSI